LNKENDWPDSINRRGTKKDGHITKKREIGTPRKGGTKPGGG